MFSQLQTDSMCIHLLTEDDYKSRVCVLFSEKLNKIKRVYA